MRNQQDEVSGQPANDSGMQRGGPLLVGEWAASAHLAPAFSHPAPTAYNEMRDNYPSRNPRMPLSGEAIRLMNLIDDVAVTLRRVLAAASTLSPEERVRVAEHLTKTRPNVEDVAQALNAK
jgi:hypothetical protein